MSVNVFNPNSEQQVQLSLTPSAVVHCQEQIAKENANGLRIAVKESGCSGYMYVLDYLNEADLNSRAASDIEIDIDADFTLLLDSDAVKMINGTQLDYIQDGLNRQLVFKNPNVQGECGCGESFIV